MFENTGTPLFGEAAAFEEPDELKTVLEVVVFPGSKTSHTDRDVGVYAPCAEARAARHC